MARYFIFLSLLLLIIAYSCEKEKNQTPPVLELRTGEEYISEGAIVSEGKLLKFGVIVNKGDAKITNIVIKRISGNNIKTLLDRGIYVDMIDTTYSFYKDSCKSEEWVISVMDQNRQTATTKIHITKNDIISYGEIIFHPSITLGYQKNTTHPHFFDPVNGKSYFTKPLESEQNTTDILVYYYTDVSTPSPTFSSPAEQDAPGYYPEFSTWTIKNYTAYDYVTKVTSAEFDAAINDSMLIKKYDDLWGRRKYKYAVANTIFPFKTTAGKLGLIKVISADLYDTGKITFAMKIQK